MKIYFYNNFIKTPIFSEFKLGFTLKISEFGAKSNMTEKEDQLSLPGLKSERARGLSNPLVTPLIKFDVKNL